MKICVIGAGGSGLIAIKHATDLGCEVIAFEQSDKVGGLWNFSEKTETDENGAEAHSSLYENLTTNLPIESMCYPKYPFKPNPKSYVPSADILQYYKDFTEDMGLKKFIKFEHQIIRVRPLADDSWEVIVKNLELKSYKTIKFDAVMVCTGHFHSGFIPEFEGQEHFEGRQFHSCKYRKAEIFKNEKVLVIGGAYSGFDIVQESSKFADRVTWSHHLPENPSSEFFKPNVNQKPDPKKFTKTGVQFTDGSFEEFTVVVYCTGYLYKFPFLSVDCDINTSDNFVKPLWMHVVNIEHPTMAIIGLNHLICPNQTYDVQVRFFLKFLNGGKSFPTKKEMYEALGNDLKTRKDKGMSLKQSHHLGDKALADYYRELADIASIEPIHPVIPKLHTQSLVNRKNDYIGFHDYKFEVLDENSFRMWKI